MVNIRLFQDKKTLKCTCFNEIGICSSAAHTDMCFEVDWCKEQHLPLTSLLVYSFGSVLGNGINQVTQNKHE